MIKQIHAKSGWILWRKPITKYAANIVVASNALLINDDAANDDELIAAILNRNEYKYDDGRTIRQYAITIRRRKFVYDRNDASELKLNDEYIIIAIQLGRITVITK